MRCILLLVLPSALIAGGAPRILEHPTNWENPKQATIEDGAMAFDFETRYRHFKNDGIFFMSRFNGGWVFMSSLVGWQYGPIRKWAIYALVSEPDGTRHWATHEIQENDVHVAPDHIYLKGGKNYVDGRGMTYKLHYDFEGFYCDLTYKNVLPPWIAGDGWIYLTPEKDIFNHYMMNCPWADVTGTMKVGGKTLNVVGQGYSDRSNSVLPPTRQNPYLYSLRTFSSEGTPRGERWFFGLLESISHKEYGSKRIPMLLLAHGDEWVITTKKYTLVARDYVKDPGAPYEYPKRLVIRGEDQGYKYNFEYKCLKLFDFTDIFGELPEWIRKLALKFMKRPVFFRSLGELTGTLEDPDGKITNIHLYGPHEYMVVK